MQDISDIQKEVACTFEVDIDALLLGLGEIYKHYVIYLLWLPFCFQLYSDHHVISLLL